MIANIDNIIIRLLHPTQEKKDAFKSELNVESRQVEHCL